MCPMRRRELGGPGGRAGPFLTELTCYWCCVRGVEVTLSSPDQPIVPKALDITSALSPCPVFVPAFFLFFFLAPPPEGGHGIRQHGRM